MKTPVAAIVREVLFWIVAFTPICLWPLWLGVYLLLAIHS